MMSLVNIVIIAACMGMTHGLRCEWPGQNDNSILGQVQSALHECPGVLDASDKSYCCLDQHGNLNCCNFTEFFLTYIIIAAITVAVISILCCIVSCCCCPCCCLYKRRHGMPV